MRQVIQEGINLAEQLAALPFKAARQAVQGSDASQNAFGDVVQESLHLGEGLARLPFKAAGALFSEMARSGPTLEQRVAELEKRLGVEPQPQEPAG